MTTDPRHRDAMRGVMWEDKYRGRLEDHPTPELLESAAKRWLGKDPDPSTSLTSKTLGEEGFGGVGWGTYGWKYGAAVVEAALEARVPLIDTAEGYGFGRVEKELGRVFVRTPPSGGTWVATKVARNHMSAAAVVSAGRRSRDALCLEAIDLYQIHWPVMKTLPRTFDGLADLLREGVIRRVGVSNFCAGQLGVAQELAIARGFQVVTNQIRLNRNDPGAVDYLIPYCRRAGVKVVTYSPLGQGDRTLRADPVGSVQWVLDHGADVTLVGTNDPNHLREVRGIRPRNSRGRIVREQK